MSESVASMAANMASREAGAAAACAISLTQRLLARHLHLEHGWGIRRTARELGMREATVRACVRAALGEDK